MQLPALAPSAPFLLPRPDGSHLPLALKPLSLGFQRRLRERGITPPIPPLRVQRDSAGRLLRNEQGTPLTTSDCHDPEFLHAQELYHQRVAVMAVIESLKDDPHFQLATPAVNEGVRDWTAYADQVFAEMEQAGLAAGDLIRLCEAICRISNLLDRHLAAADASFFSPAPPPATPPPA